MVAIYRKNPKKNPKPKAEAAQILVGTRDEEAQMGSEANDEPKWVGSTNFQRVL